MVMDWKERKTRIERSRSNRTSNGGRSLLSAQTKSGVFMSRTDTSQALINEKQAHSNRQRRLKVSLAPMPWDKEVGDDTDVQ